MRHIRLLKSNMSNKLYIVEQILKRKTTKKGPMYLVKWKGYPLNQSTWQPKQNLFYLREDKFKNELNRYKKINNSKIRRSNKDKSNQKKDQLNSVSKQKNQTALMTPTTMKSQEQWQTKRQQTSWIKKDILQLLPRPHLQPRVKIIRKYKGHNGKKLFIFQEKSPKYREMTDLQMKALYPTELCIFYQELIQKVLLNNKK